MFERILFPIFREFKPEAVFISCGFDAFVNDPLGGPGAYLEKVYEYLIEKIH